MFTGNPPKIGQAVTLVTGVIEPVGATLDYQWQINNGTYIDIPGATSNTYTPVATDEGKYLQLIVTGTGSYSGNGTFTISTPITQVQ